MRLAPFVCSIAAVLVLNDAPLSTPMPGVPDAPVPHSERLMGIISTQGTDCVRRSQDCTFKPCCENAGKCFTHGREGQRTCS